MIRIDRLRFSYRQRIDTIRLAEFELDAPGNILVGGPSGCGKATLLYLIAGVLQATRRRVIIQ